MNEAKPIVIGKRHQFQSKVLDEQREFWVSLPDGYCQGDHQYPVLYLLDGDWHFHHVSGLVKFLIQQSLMPTAIVVGICHRDRIRELSPTHQQELQGFRFPTSGGGEAFLEF